MGSAWRVPAYWPGGVRHAGDVSPVCGARTERGKAHPDTAAALLWQGERENLNRLVAGRG